MQPPTSSGGVSSGVTIGFNVGYFFSILGILRCVELLFTIIIMSTAAGCYGYCNGAGMGFVVFVAVVAMLGNLCIILLGAFNIFYEVQWKAFMEIVYSASCVILYFISLIVSAVSSDRSWSRHSAWAAAAVFCAFNMILYAVDIAFRLFILRKR